MAVCKLHCRQHTAARVITPRTFAYGTRNEGGAEEAGGAEMNIN